jgi:hypothetical protein
MSENQENAVRNAWLDLSSLVQHLTVLREAGTFEENLKSEELINASTESVRELEGTFSFLPWCDFAINHENRGEQIHGK